MLLIAKILNILRYKYLISKSNENYQNTIKQNDAVGHAVKGN